MKRHFIASVLMLLLMVCLPVRAASTGSLTLQNTQSGQTYSLYQLLVLNDDGTYSPASGWSTFLTNQGMTINNDVVDAVNIADAQTFASNALLYASGQSISPYQSASASGDTLSFSNLPLGYYVVSSSKGSLCTLVNVDGAVVAQEKNATPTLIKQVMENGAWSSTSSASIGSTVQFELTLTIGSDPADYVITDTMQTSFTYKSLDSISCSGTPLTSADYTLVQKDNVLTFSFDNTWLASQQEGDIITIQYSAILNNTATLDGLSAGNSNTAVLTHSAGSVSSKVTVWTYEAQIVKTDTENTVISGAVFEISQNGNTLSFVDEGNNTYKLSDGTESSTVSQITGGVITLQGLGAGTYSLTEIQAPSGYNKLTSPQTFEMSTRNNWAQVTKTDSDTIYNSGGIHVVNNTGIVLPETGGPGNAAILCTALGLFVCGVWLVRHDRS